MKPGTLAKYGTTRTTFSGNVEREDAQPNEGLIRKRTTGPPALKPTAPPARSFQPRWGQFGNRGRGWSRPGNNWNHSPHRPVTEFNSAGPSHIQSQYIPMTPSRGTTRSSGEESRASQFPPRHNKRRKTTHDREASGGDPPQRLRFPPGMIRLPVPHQPAPSTSTPPSVSQSHLPVPPLPSRVSKRPSTTPYHGSHTPPAPPTLNFTHSTSPLPRNLPTTTMPVKLPISLLPALHQLGIVPVPTMVLPTASKPQPPAILHGQSSDGTVLSLEINLSLLQDSQMTGLATLLQSLTKQPVSVPKPPPQPPQPPISPSSECKVPTMQPAQPPISPYDVPTSTQSPPLTPARKSPRQIKEEPSTPSSSFTPLPLPSQPRPGEIAPGPRRLVRQACTRFILPYNCHSAHNPDGFQEARRVFFRQKREYLKGKGLSVEKKVVLREDGLVLEWTSPVPVWTDTFLPEAGTDLASAINETSLGNTRIAARSSKRGRSNSTSTSTSTSTSRLGSTPAPIIVLHDSPPPTPQPPSRCEVESVEDPEPSASSTKIIRPSQVIPPNSHPRKRMFKPVHVPRLGVVEHSTVSLAAEGREREGSERQRGDTGSTVEEVLKRSSKAAVSPEPLQPRPMPSPTLPTGILEELSEGDVLPQVPASVGADDQQPPLASPATSSYLEGHNDVGPTIPDALPPTHVASVKKEESVAIDVAYSAGRWDTIASTADISVEPVMEVAIDDEEEGSEDLSMEGEDVLNLARQFLLRYIDTFDHNRTQLQTAYGHNATFSVRIHDDTGAREGTMATSFCTEDKVLQRRASNASSQLLAKPVSKDQPSRIYHGQEDIVNRLCSLGPHKFLSPRLPHVHPSPVYDITAHPILPSPSLSCTSRANESESTMERRELVLASLHSEAVNTTRMGRSVVMDHIVSVDQNFVLQTRDEAGPGIGDNDGRLGTGTEEPWPLVVISHQMVVRDGPMLRQEEIGELMPWVLNIRAEDFECE